MSPGGWRRISSQDQAIGNMCACESVCVCSVAGLDNMGDFFILFYFLNQIYGLNQSITFFMVPIYGLYSLNCFVTNKH